MPVELVLGGPNLPVQGRSPLQPISIFCISSFEYLKICEYPFGIFRFFKAKLFNTDFTDADLTNASIEDDGLEGAVFDNAVLVGSYLSKEIVDAKSILNADFTDAQMPDYTRKALCKRTDISGKNPKTGEITADSLFCP